MALKQVKPQQRNKQPRATSKQVGPPKKESASDPWAFLELIDAPRWVDLSLEASLLGNEGYDPWFDRSHKHHVISLAGLNSSMTWLRLGKSNQANQVKGSALTKDTTKECQKVVYKSRGKENARQLNMAGHGQCWRGIKGVQVKKGIASQDVKNTDRASSAHLRFFGSQDTGCTFSGSSSISECEPSRSLKYRNSCSERLSVTSSVQAGSVQSNRFSSSVQKDSLNSDQPEDSFDTPTCSDGRGQNKRNSSGASYCPSRPKLRFSYELGVANLTKSQSVCMADWQSSGDSVVTIASASSWASDERVGKVCARIWEEKSSDIRKVGEDLKDHLDHGQPSSGGFTADCSTAGRNLLHCQQTARRVVKYDINIRERKSETRGSQIGSLSRKQLYSGKENVPSKMEAGGNPRQARLQVKDKPSHTAAPLAISSSKTVNAKVDTVGLSSRVGCRGLQIKTEERHRYSARCPLACAEQVLPPKSNFLQSLNGNRISSVAHQRKRNEAKLPTVDGSASEKTCKFEKDLAALVAQHNQKIRTLGLHERRKGLR